MDFLFGFLGALLAVALFASGVAVGCFAHKKLASNVTAEALTEAQKQRVREEQEAWMALHNYSADTAYGVYMEKQRSDD